MVLDDSDRTRFSLGLGLEIIQVCGGNVLHGAAIRRGVGIRYVMHVQDKHSQTISSKSVMIFTPAPAWPLHAAASSEAPVVLRIRLEILFIFTAPRLHWLWIKNVVRPPQSRVVP